MTSRRQFITLLGGAAAMWPISGFTQPRVSIPLIGFLIGSVDNPTMRLRVSAFLEELSHLGWTPGHNVRLELRWGGSKPNALARELVALQPNVIVAGPTNAFLPVQAETRTIPIVFVSVSDPLGQGFVQSMSRPIGNATGFSNLEFSLLGKWLQILKEAAPGIRRVGLLISNSNASSPGWYRTFNDVAPRFAIEPVAAPLANPSEVEGILTTLARVPNSGLIVAGDSVVEAPNTRRQIIELTAKYRLPALYGVPLFRARWRIYLVRY